MCNSVNNTYKKHLPVYIYMHSSLIQPVEITALQIIIIIDPSEIHSPRLNIMIYIQFKKNQRRDTSIQGSEICSYNLCCEHFFCWKTSMLFPNQEAPIFTHNFFVSEFHLFK